MQGNGPNYTLKIGRTTMDAKDLLKNVNAAVYSFCAHLMEVGKLEPEDIRRVSLKGATSPALPVYSFLSEREKNLLPDAIQMASQ